MTPPPAAGETPRRACHRLLLPLALALVAASGIAAQAQIIQLDPPGSQEDGEPAAPAPPEPEPEPGLSEPPPPGAPVGDRGRGDRPDPIAEGTGAEATGETLLPLRPATPRADALSRPRLAGEVARDRFILFLPVALDATQLHLAHRSGIDVLPEMSRIDVVINGTLVGAVEPGNFDAFGRDVIDVPDGVLQAGQNRVEIVARHSHRIACGPEAAFALWTEIDIGASGVMVPPDALTPGPLAFLAALSAQSARGDPVVIRRPDPSASLTDAAPFIAQVVSALGGTPPAIESAPYWTLSEGAADLVRITAFEPGSDADTPRFERGGDGAIVLLVERGSAYDDVSSMLLDPAEVAEAATVPVLQPGGATPLSELDAPSLQAEGRYALVPVRFRLPGDWLLLASQKARLDLDYGFAPDLPDGSLMLVKVNGTTVRLLPLDIEGGDALPTLPIRFQANLLRPGINRLDFEILVPGDPPNVACPPIEGPIVDIIPSSRLLVPGSPAMSLPSLDAALDLVPADGIRLTEAAARQMPPGFVPQVAAGLLLGARAPVPGATLTIGTVADLDRVRGPLIAEAARPMATVLRGRIPDAAAAGPAPRAAADDGPVAWLTALPERLVTSMRRLAYGDTPDLVTWLEGRSARAALLQPDPADETAIWLIVAPGGDPSDVARALAAGRGSASGPVGQVALYTPGSGWQSWTTRDRPLSLLEPLGVGNLRAVMGNYATLSPLGFAAVFLGLTAISALVAIWILLLTRRGRS